MSSDASKPDSKLCILKAATGLFARLGLDKCSTREIAKEAHSNISLISYYFGGKEGLYKEVMRSHALEIKSNAEAIIGDIDDAEVTREIFIRDIGSIIDSLIQTRLKNPELSKIFAREKLAGLPHAREIHSEIFYPLIQKFYKLFKAGQKNGFVKAEINPALFFIMMSEGIWGFFQLMECGTRLSHDCEELAKDATELKNQILNIYLTGALT